MEEHSSENCNIANKILKEIQSDKLIKNQIELLNDEFFVHVMSVLAYEDTFQIEIGQTRKEKVENLNRIKQFLSNILEIDLTNIIRDQISVAYLLDLIYELIKVLKKREEKQETEANEERHDKEQFQVNQETPTHIQKEEIEILNNLKLDGLHSNVSNYDSENKKESGSKLQIHNQYTSNNSDISKNLKETSLLNFDNTKLSEKGYTYIGDRSTSKNTQTIAPKSRTNSQNKNLNEMSFRNNISNWNDKSSYESEISIISNHSNVNTFSKKSSHSFNNSGSAEWESLIPLNNLNFKNEISKEINSNVNLHIESSIIQNLNKKNLNDLFEKIIKKVKEFKLKNEKRSLESEWNNMIITKDFLLSFRKEFEEIIRNCCHEIKNKNRVKTKVVNKMIKNIKAVEQIENKKFKIIEDKIKKQKEDYNRNKKNSLNQIEFVNNL